MGKTKSTSASGKVAEKAERVQLGDYWLEWRAERDQWCIAWYDPEAGTRRRRSTGIRGGSPDSPPEAARKALASHYLETKEPDEPQAPAEASVADMLTHWLTEHVANLNAPDRYAYSAQHWLRFFEREKKLGKIIGGATVKDINNRLVDRFIAFRRSDGVGGHTISRDLAALRGALSHNWREERIASVPFIKDVDTKAKAKPRELTYTMEQLAALLEAAWASPDRHHVFRYCMIVLSTLGRSEAVLELDADTQIKKGLIHFLDPDEDQTSKRRSIVPVAPTLAPWLEGLSGRVIMYRAEIARRKWADPEVPEYHERTVADIGNSFDACLVAAGISRPVLDDTGAPAMLPARAKLGETQPRPHLRGIGTPNTLRHTIITEMHSRGVDERQIDMAAGHAPIGTGKRNYMHLRPDFLAQLVAAIEDFWSDMRHFTTVHVRSQHGPNVVSMAQIAAGIRAKNGGI